MTRIATTADNAPSPAGPYSHGVEANGFFYTAGFGPQHPQTGEFGETITEQTAEVLRNIGAVLRARGLSFDDVVKTTVHLADLADFDAYNAVYAEFFTAPYPVRTTVGSQLMGILVEIDVVAAIPQD